ncbi:MAG: carboxypeptidase-like regulatory domain-containing protein, partial [Flavobacterium sp.]
MHRTLLLLSVLLFQIAGFSQNITAKIVDAKTGESIPYANILVSGTENLITNEEGVFTVSDKNNDAVSLAVSYLGYVGQLLTVGDLKKQQGMIKLQPGVFELEDVDVNKIKPNANAVMAKVKENIKKNHGVRPEAMKKTLFMRDFGTFKPKKLDIEITKSTGFSKNALKEANADVASFTSKLMSNPPQEFTDVLANYYSGTVAGKEKPVFTNKLDVVKATKLKDENRAVSIDNMEKMAANIFLKHLDTTKYYRIKSGWFGSRDTISLRKDFNKKKKKKEKRTELGSAKTNLYSILAQNDVLGNRLDFA